MLQHPGGGDRGAALRRAVSAAAACKEDGMSGAQGAVPGATAVAQHRSQLLKCKDVRALPTVRSEGMIGRHWEAGKLWEREERSVLQSVALLE